jgi:hypothetical protein
VRILARLAPRFLTLALMMGASGFALADLPQLPAADGGFDPRLHGPGVHPSATAIVAVGEDFFLAGLTLEWLEPPTAGDLELTGVAVWNSATELFAQIPGEFTGAVDDLEFFEGELYAAGSFTAIDSAPYPGLARWNGQQWSPVGVVTHEGTIDLEIVDGNLYAYGLKSADGLTIFRVGRWDGSAWSKPVFDFGSLVTFALRGDEVFASTTTAFHPMQYYNGTSWSSMTYPAPFINGSEPLFLTFLNGTLYAAGRFQSLDPYDAKFIARWNGTVWEKVGPDLPSAVEHFAASDEAIFVVVYSGGVQVIRRWDGATWTQIGVLESASGLGTAVHRIKWTDGKLAITGAFGGVSGVRASSAAWWDPATAEWHAINDERGLGVVGGVLASAANQTGVYVQRGSDIVRWDDGQWTPLGDAGAISISLLSASGKKVFGLGSWLRDGVQRHGLSRWNGTGWSPVRRPPFSGFEEMTASNGKLYVAGNFYPDAPVSFSKRAALGIWDGSRWTFPPSRAQTEYLAAIAVTDNGNVFLAGNISKIENVPVSQLARWDGTRWRALGVVDGGQVNHLVAIGNALYAGGSFRAIAGMSAYGLAKWENGTWSRVGELDGPVQALATDGKYLYAQRYFVDGVQWDNALVRWDGEIWERISTAPDYTPTMSARGGQLFPGGRFHSIDGLPSLGIARWSGCDVELSTCFTIESSTTTTLSTSTTSTTTTTTLLEPTTTSTEPPPPTTTVTSSTSSTASTSPDPTSTSTIVDLTSTTEHTTTTLEAVCGDADENGSIEASDALTALRRAIGTGFCRNIVCDVDASGEVNASDALIILRAAVGQSAVLTCA